jgi:hypothetical protein
MNEKKKKVKSKGVVRDFLLGGGGGGEKGKGKGHPITGHPLPRGGVEVQLYSFSTSALG